MMCGQLHIYLPTNTYIFALRNRIHIDAQVNLKQYLLSIILLMDYPTMFSFDVGSVSV